MLRKWLMEDIQKSPQEIAELMVNIMNYAHNKS